MHVPSLPIELIDIIADFLRDDRDTLSACARVSLPWLHPSRRRLFSRIKTHYHKLVDLLYFLDSDRGIAICDRVLTLSLDGNKSRERLSLTLLVSVYTKLKRLRTLNLDELTIDSDQLSRRTGGPFIALDTLSASSFGRTYYSDISNFLVFLDWQFSHIKTLKIGEFSFNGRHCHSQHPITFQLNTLVLRVGYGFAEVYFLEVLRETRSARTLRALDLTGHTMVSFTSAFDFMTEEGTDVVDLALSVTEGRFYDSFERRVPGFSPCTSLRRLTVRVQIEPDASNDPASGWSRAVKLLLYAPSTITHITLSLSGSLDNVVAQFSASPLTQTLDGTFQSLPHLVSVRIDSTDWLGSQAETDGVGRTVFNALPRTFERGLIQINLDN